MTKEEKKKRRKEKRKSGSFDSNAVNGVLLRYTLF
jgi:hypothetical protein